jgi:hypothetical protein
MPIILSVPQDPTDLVISGEQMRMSVMDDPVSVPGGLLSGAPISAGLSSLVRDEDVYPPMNSMVETSLLAMRRLKNGWLQMRNNAGISTPTGAWIWNDYAPLILRFDQASVLWAISGVTKDSAGAPLGNCRIVAFETGRIEIGEGESEAGETLSDGSGNYVIPVALNTAHQLTAYKAGSPDVAGITRNDITPLAVG